MSPVGLSFVTKVAPVKIASMMMGVWFLSNFTANLVGGYIAGTVQKVARGEVFTLLGGQADFFLIFVTHLIRGLRAAGDPHADAEPADSRQGWLTALGACAPRLAPAGLGAIAAGVHVAPSPGPVLRAVEVEPAAALARHIRGGARGRVRTAGAARSGGPAAAGREEGRTVS